MCIKCVNHQLDFCVPAFPTPAVSLPATSFNRARVDPLERILRAYDRAINACESFDHAKSRTAIGMLRKALELDTPEARSFDSLYGWCEASVDRRDFIAPARCLRSLRDAWCRATEPRSIALRSDRPLS